MKNHTCVAGKNIDCEQCDFKADTVSVLVTHILGTHENKSNPEHIECPHCEVRVQNKQQMKDHIEKDHWELSFMSYIISNLENLTRNFESFKTELTDVLNVIINDHNVIKQELFVHRQDNHQGVDRMKKIEQGIANMTKMISTQTSPYTVSDSSSNMSQSISKPTVPPPSTKPSMRSPNSTKTGATKVCLVGDSISSNIDLNVIANAMKAEVTTAKAYSSRGKTEENEAKHQAKFPDLNFEDVLEMKVKDEEPDILLVQAGAVDITNLKTGGENPDKYGEYFRQETIMSATNLFSSVSNTLLRNPNLKKVILMKQIPRYDSAATDPRAVKRGLVHLFNDKLVQLWQDCPYKDRLSLGSHRLECSGAIRESRYTHNRKYDGIHMFGQSGRKAYTESVLMLLRDTGLVLSNPPRFFRRYHQARGHAEYSAETNSYICPTQDTDWLYDRDVRQHHHQQPHYPNTSGEYHCPTQHTDHLNDRDIRTRRTYAEVAGTPVYGVPTANRFSLFAQENY